MKTPVKSLIAVVECFEPLHSYSDQVWRFWFQARKKWTQLRVQKVGESYYFFDGESNTFEHPSERDSESAEVLASKWLPLLVDWKRRVSKGSLPAQSELAARLPLYLKQGTILRKNVVDAIPALNLAQHFSRKQLADLTSLLLKPREGSTPTMTAAQYFDYCRIAYEANPQKLPRGRKHTRTGREYYEALADSRDGGLLAVTPNSAEAFEAWYESAEHQGCHPWEIYRGGNSTHIDLSVYRRDDRQWQVGLTAFSSTRFVETCNIALALHRANLPFVLHHAESYLLRLRGEDWVGIIPDGEPIRYAWHEFPREYHVADVIHLKWLFEANESNAARAKLARQYGKIINWFSLPVSAWLRR